MTTPSVEGALAKIDRVLPEAARERVQALQESLVLNIPSSEFARPAPGSSVVLTFSIATQQR